MHTVTRIPLALACAIGFTLAGPALAQDRSAGHDHAGHATQAAQASASMAAPEASASTSTDLPLVEAEVRRVDVRNNKLSLRHQHIPNLDMPPMTMVFQVSDAKLLDGLKAGDKLRVTIDEINGTYTVLSVEPTQP